MSTGFERLGEVYQTHNTYIRPVDLSLFFDTGYRTLVEEGIKSLSAAQDHVTDTQQNVRREYEATYDAVAASQGKPGLHDQRWGAFTAVQMELVKSQLMPRPVPIASLAAMEHPWKKKLAINLLPSDQRLDFIATSNGHQSVLVSCLSVNYAPNPEALKRDPKPSLTERRIHRLEQNYRYFQLVRNILSELNIHIAA